VWLTSRREAGYLAVVTETGTAASVTESAGRIRALLARRYGPSVVLLEHYPAPEFGEGAETLDLVRVGADGSPVLRQNPACRLDLRVYARRSCLSASSIC
jgi:hypothetical protein